MNELFQTGMALIDNNLGGLLPGRPYFAFGDGGTGKSLLGLQFLHAGIERGEPGLLLTLERPEDLLPQAERMGFPLEPALKDGRLLLLEYDRNATGNILRFGWKPFLDQIHGIGESHGVRRAVFDPVHPLVVGNIEEGRLRYDMRYLVENLEEWGWTTLFLNERGATQGHPSFYRVFSEICSGVFELQDETEELTVDKFLFVHKLRHATGPRRKIPFQIVTGQGLVEAAPPASSVSLSSAPGAGNPSGAGHVDSGQSASAAAAPEGGEGPATVLIADDDPFIRKILARKLGDEFRVLFAQDGVEALTMTLTERPTVLVLDVVLPKVDGFEVCRSLRKGGHQMPILFVSGGALDENDRLRGLLLGANDYISKPFSVQEVVEKIRNACRYRPGGAIPPAAEKDLDVLLRAAKERRLNPEEFTSRCAEAWIQAARYETALGLVRVRWSTQEGEPDPAEILGQALERLLPPEDSLVRWSDQEWALLRNASDRAEILAFLRSLRRAGEIPLISPRTQILVSFGIFRPSPGEAWDANAILARAAQEERDLLRDLELQIEPQENSGNPDAGTHDTGGPGLTGFDSGQASGTDGRALGS